MAPDRSHGQRVAKGKGKGTADEWQGHYPKGLKRRSHHDAARSMLALFQRRRPMPLSAAITAELAKGYSILKITSDRSHA
jgi:hypothetical protein